ncbi:MAG TPA: HPr-rel-A system PqqD family peptide chaperone [Allocoleopsis sp.]
MLANALNFITHSEKNQPIVLKPLNLTADRFAFDPSTGESYTLNACGRLILQLLQQGQTRQQIARVLAAEFGIAQSTAERDVSDFLQTLNLLGLLGGDR